MGGQGSADLANPIAARLQHHHPRAGELLWRHGAGELGAEQHQVEGVTGWRRRSGRPSLRRQGGEGLGSASASWGASWDARPAAVRARPLGARGRGGAGRGQTMGTKAQVGEERANGHRNPNMNIETNLTLNAAKVPLKGGKSSAHNCCVSAIAKCVALAATKEALGNNVAARPFSA